MKNDQELKSERFKYPIGRFDLPKKFGKAELNRAKSVIGAFPTILEKEVISLKQDGLLWKYRPKGWNIKEVVHHCVDSHINAFVRFKKALTEESPQITGYDESAWAQMTDNQNLPIQNALDILKPLHFRWTFLLEHITRSELEKGYYHPESQRVVKLTEATFHYEWHCNHHFAHVLAAKKNKF